MAENFQLITLGTTQNWQHVDQLIQTYLLQPWPLMQDWVILRPWGAVIFLLLLGVLWILNRQQQIRVPDWHWLPEARRAPMVQKSEDSTETRTWFSRILTWVGIFSVLLALIAPAKEQEMPVAQQADALVLVMDLSLSMLAQDQAPNRLERAKIKLLDSLRQRTSGLSALVVFAQSAHILTPLTTDQASLAALIPMLHPQGMPVPGSNPDAGLAKAGELLASLPASYQKRVVLISDRLPHQCPTYPLDVFALLMLGTENGGTLAQWPVQYPEPENKDLALDIAQVQAFAEQCGARWSVLTHDQSDLQQLQIYQTSLSVASETKMQARYYQDYTAWAVWPLLLSLAYRWRYQSLLWGCLLLTYLPQAIYAQTSIQTHAETNRVTEIQQEVAQHPAPFLYALAQKQMHQAAEYANHHPFYLGILAYRQQRYAQAAQAFAQAEKIWPLTHPQGLAARFNHANALLLAGQAQTAASLYAQILQTYPQHIGSRHNYQIAQTQIQRLTHQSRTSKSQTQTPPVWGRQQEAQKETQARHANMQQGLGRLNLITDDPWALLRRKLQAEYKQGSHQQAATEIEVAW
ncbi:Ca-activated chloride channel family protein [Allopseudospirillum japonicum]|uniref:Ca-activated chloride channel family protein n=1 Tax=Allopseudospirillum japonicum TaxID=64971 RepID=A0A1H6SY39_9GAMM|nr:VWA domain-containing protein [Allopseudospirillum japonicum]SEI72813.1 Ca-activated chloride channel family protein [Allopseudospirillum japonicum]